MSDSVVTSVSGNKAQKFTVLANATNVVAAQSVFPAAPGFYYEVYHVCYSASAAGSVTLNNGSTAMYAPLTLGGAGTVSAGNPASGQPICRTAPGAALTITPTGTATHVAAIVYAKLHT